MYINKLDEIKKEFLNYDYDDIEELIEDIEKIKEILTILQKKEIAIEISIFDME